MSYQAGAYPGSGPPPAMAYPGGAYQGGAPPPAGAYPGGAPAGAYPGGAPTPAGAYQGGAPPPAGAYPGGAPAGAYPGGGAPYPPAGSVPGPAGQAGQAPPAPYKGEMPPEDVKDDPNVTGPPPPSAPPLDLMDTFAGYNNVGFEGASLPPPSYDEAVRQAPPSRESVEGVAAVTEEEVRHALYQFVSEHCCYGKGPAEEIRPRDLKSTSAFHYTLETYGESRSTQWANEPYTGQPISVTGPPPQPWDIQANPAEMFKTSKLDVEVPNTCSVKPCHGCFASGYIRCYRCHGRGRLFCTSCIGRGWKEETIGGQRDRRQCYVCHGSGRKTCYTCNSMGQVQCTTCRGRGNLKWFIKLTIRWSNHKDDHIVERTALPDELIRGVTGHVAFQESQPRVWPVNHFPDAEINQASNSLVNSHGSKFGGEKILMQRHQVRIIPVTEVSSTYKDKQLTFFVYGFENKVYFPDYPAKCCCGCSVL